MNCSKESIHGNDSDFPTLVHSLEWKYWDEIVPEVGGINLREKKEGGKN